MIEWLKGKSDSIDSDGPDLTYLLEEVKSKFEVKELIPGNSWLVLSWDDAWLKFALLEFHSSDG